MRRHGNLWNKFISKENFKLAWKLTAKNRGKRCDVRNFKKNLETNLENLRQEVIQHKFKTSKYSTKKICENGKRRVIYMLPIKDRIVHHALINIIEDLFVKRFITHTYGCIKDRGQIKGSLYCRKMIMKYKYCLKTDVKKFYPSINQQLLYNYITKVIKDKELLSVIHDIVFSFPGGVNCPIGNLPSQLFGNIYENEVNKFIKHKLKVKTYFRYCDDCVILSNSKEELHNIKSEIEKFTKQNQKQDLSYAEVFPVKQGIDFLGYRHFQGYTLLRKRTALKFKRAVNRIKSGKDKRPLLQQLCTISSYKGYTNHCYCYNLVRSLDLDNLLKDLTVKEFNKIGPKPELPITGKRITILQCFDKPLIVTAWKPCKVKGEDSNKIQFMFENDPQDKELHITFTRSKVLRGQLEKINKEDFPFKAVLKQQGNSYYLE